MPCNPLRKILAMACLTVALSAAPRPAHASVTTLWDFMGNVFNGGTNADAALPRGTVIAEAPGGPYYGTTYHGGVNGDGAVYQIDYASGTERVIWSFGGGADGRYPYGGVIEDGNGNLFGTTVFGDNGSGVNEGIVYELTPSGPTA